MHLVWWILGIFILLYLVQSIYLGIVLKWEDEQTAGLGYYGRSAVEREQGPRVGTVAGPSD